MRPFIPAEILARETVDLEKSVAADLAAPDRSVASIIAPEPAKSTKKGKEVENTPKHDAGTGSNNDNSDIPASGK